MTDRLHAACAPRAAAPLRVALGGDRDSGGPRAGRGLTLVAAWVVASSAACTGDDKTGQTAPDAVARVDFATPCDSDDQCGDHVCVPHIANTVCSQACDAATPCPDGWSCWSPPPSPGDGRPASYCVSPFWALCRPCASDAVCGSVTSDGNAGCVDYLGQGAFCATGCADETDCPPGFACAEVEALSGGVARRCVESHGMCPCTPYLGHLGEPTRCTSSNTWGDCVGQRVCDGASWSACDAPSAAADIPNGRDDDCDGATDELVCACGDGVCDGACGERAATCPCDCAAPGDGVCSPCGESPLTAPVDCCRSTTGTSGCGDGFCTGFDCGETPGNCPEDCGHACGDGACEPGETPYTCAEDCAHKVCGNHVCESTDGGPEKCPQDCKPFCGDCECDPARDESVFNCPIDCGYCGDGDCSPCAVVGETRESCASDCCVPHPETCDGEDDDCDGATDEEGAVGCVELARDHDGDGLGAAGSGRCLCAPAGEWTASATGDCDDGDREVGAGQPETCDGEDDDCDGATDEDFDVGAACTLDGTPCALGTIACDGPDRAMCTWAGDALPGTLCQPLACVDGLVVPPGVCDDAGGCVVLPPVGCDGFACAAAGRCLDRCASDADCRSGWACGIDGSCERVAPLCARASDCVDEDWRTVDVCVVTCGHLPRAGADPDGDLDGDGVENGADVCPETVDPSQTDSDHDGRGDACDRCSGPGAPERCNGVDDDCNGATDEAFDLGVSCRNSATACDAGEIACDGAGGARCELTGSAPAGVACGPASCDAASGSLRLAARCDGAGACAPGALVDCAGYVCGAVDGEAACLTHCRDGADCRAGRYCDSGVCAPTRAAGAACDDDAACASGFCVDGVCCHVPCDGPCQRCGAGGVCEAVAPGTDPDGECAACATCDARGECAAVGAGADPKAACDAAAGERCGLTGACDGTGACAFGAAGTTCSDRRCQDGAVADAFRCDGNGRCAGSDALACPDGLACAADGSACLARCADDRGCVGGHWCDVATGRCRPLGDLGAACTEDRACRSGACADGLCCDAPCDGGCVTCAAPATAGHCTPRTRGTDIESACSACSACDGAGACAPVATGTDPLGDCADDPATCGTTGLCDGAGACAFDPATVTCGAARCVGETAVSARVCSGRGACADATLTACVGARCDPATGACKATCASAADCQAGFACAADHTCRALAALGAPCSSAAGCASGACADGVCCERACAGACEACAAGTGRCGAVADGVVDPLCGAASHCEAGACARDDGARCGLGSECGSGLCVGGTCCATACDGVCETCATGACAPADRAQTPGRCDGATWCVAGACVPLVGSPCGPAAPCPSGLACLDGACGTPAPLGTSCLGDAKCASGHCVDGVCCDGACDGACLACGASGHCAPLAVGAASADECGPGQACAADGTCRAADGVACLEGATCASGRCVDGACCATACDGTCESCATGACLALTGPSPECPADEVCSGVGTCAHLGVTSCDEPGDCASGTCVLLAPGLGTCCDRACDGPCETCAASDPLGTCQTVTASENPGRCESDKWCDKFGACVVKAGATCAATSECGPGTFCDLALASPTCAPVRALGASCGDDAACASGSCADGVCCERACDGTCERCDLPESPGRCALAPTGTDPGGDCPAGEACSRELGGCARAAGEGCLGDGECASAACLGGTCCDRACAGLCETCETGTCGLATGTATDRCEAPFTCDAAGMCRPDAGAPCASDDGCASDLCDLGTGRCCPDGCVGPCASCTAAGACEAVTSAEAPDRCDGARYCDASGQCVAKVGAACAADVECAVGLFCDAPANAPSGSCQPVRDDGAACIRGAGCASGVCADDVCCGGACDGPCETCARPGFVGSCAPAEAGTDPGDRCGPGRACSAAGACAAVLGAACAADGACASGECAGGRCCETACDGACERCDSGVCQPVASGPTAGCSWPGTCDDGRCLLADGVACDVGDQCASGACVAGLVSGRVCCAEACGGPCERCGAGTGLCTALTRAEDPGRCAGASWCDATGACRAKEGSPCVAASDCPFELACDLTTHPGVCRAPEALGAPCASDGQCDSGICSQGRCCDRRCDATCATCGTGTCTLPAAGTDPFGRCAGGQACAADGSCRAALGAPCAGDGSSCASGYCVDGRCCGTSCAAPCMACDLAPPGYCSPMASGEDEGCSGLAVECRNGQCLGDLGARCGTAGDCASGSCADGVCCDAACTGSCRACDTSGHVGACATLARVEDGACRGSAWCDMNGTCAPKDGSPCVGDLDCPGGGYSCVLGSCRTKGALGATCGSDAACTSGYCADGVCCGVRCGGLCERCDATPGTCTAVVGPDDGCSGPLACAGRGACLLADGQSCGSPTLCVSGTCEDGVCCEETCGPCQTCAGDGAGTVAGMCGPRARGEDGPCQGAAWCVDGLCQPKAETPCASTMDCPADYYCDGLPGTCRPRAALGEACTAGAPDACLVGTCVDSVCCGATACGDCQSCAVPGHLGTCSAVADGVDDCLIPGDLCHAGFCRHEVGMMCAGDAECASGQCADGVCCATDCDGTTCGNCNQPGFVGQCMPVASGEDGTCAGPYFACVDGACKLGLGTPCGLGEQCASGRCTDGVCCGAACDACAQCNVAGHAGQCTPVLRQQTARCGETAWCDIESKCLPFEAARCTVDLDCPGGYRCGADGTCSSPAPNGTTCSTASECQSGICKDGACCNSPCNGACLSCNLAGLRGTCSPVQNAPDLDACATTCDATGKCTVVTSSCLDDGGCPGGYCDLATHLCASRVGVDGACDRDSQCVSGHCDLLRHKCQ